MRSVRVIDAGSGAVIGARVDVADGWWTRLRGLIGRGPPPQDGGMLLLRCPAVHTFGLGFPIDVVMLGDDGVVTALYPDLAPRSRTDWLPGARHALELAAGRIAAAGIRTGDRLTWSPVTETEFDTDNREAA